MVLYPFCRILQDDCMTFPQVVAFEHFAAKMVHPHIHRSQHQLPNDWLLLHRHPALLRQLDIKRPYKQPPHNYNSVVYRNVHVRLYKLYVHKSLL